MNSDGQFFGKSTYQSTIHWKIVCVDMVFVVFFLVPHSFMVPRSLVEFEVIVFYVRATGGNMDDWE